MKKFLCVLGIAAMFLVGCGGDDKDDNGGGGNNNNGGNENNGGNNNNGGNENNGGSDSNDVNFNAICAGLYGEYWDFSSLDADKQSQLQSAFLAACVDDYNKLPKCKTEVYNEYKCLVVDTPMSTWDELDELEYECEENGSSEEEIAACVDAVWANSPCNAQQTASSECYESNESVMDAWSESVTMFVTVSDLISSWGLNINDYDDEGL